MIEQFGPADFRFTQGKDGSVYVFALSVPQPGAEVMIVLCRWALEQGY